MTTASYRFAKHFSATALCLTCVVGAILHSGCGGSSLPSEVNTPSGDGGPTQAPLPPINVTMGGFISGELDGAESSEARTGRGHQSSLAQAANGDPIPGANGVDLKDLGWSNLFTQGLTSSAFPTGTQTRLKLFAQGNQTPLVDTSTVGANGGFNFPLNATSLQSGSKLELELTVNGQASRITLPNLSLRNEDQIGMNLVRRQNGTLIVEFFLDKVTNATGEAGADGLADNGIRIVVDNGSDLIGDGKVQTAARLDTADGLSFFDLNLDGRFGDPENDAITFIDANDSGFADTPLVLASEGARLALNNPESVSFAFDPELDGIRAPLSDRKVAEGSESDLISNLSVFLTPASLPANGVSAATIRVLARSGAKGFPLNAPLRFDLERFGGELLVETGEARFRSSGSTFAARTLSPTDPDIRILSDGTFEINESVLMPMLIPSSVVGEEHSARLVVEVDTGERLQGAPSVLASREVQLLPSMAPILSNVLVAGQYDVTGVTGGLESVSRAAVLTPGARVRVDGQNFAQTVADNRVAIGGTQVSNLTVNSIGTQLEFDVPVGAITGPVSVIVGGLGGITSQNLVIAGEQLAILSVLPAGQSVPTNTRFSLGFSRDLDVNTVNATSVFVRPVGGASLDWTVSLESARTVSLSQGSGASLSVGDSYEIVVTSNLGVLGTNPLVRFDPVLSQPLTEVPETATVASFTASAIDDTGAALLSSIPANAAQAVDPFGSITLTFNEPLNPDSVQGAINENQLRIAINGGVEFVGFSWALNSGGTQLVLSPSDSGFPGGTSLTVMLDEVNQEAAVTDHHGSHFSYLTDLAGNPTDAFQVQFTTSIGVSAMSPRSGPIGSKILVEGIGFESTTSPLAVQLGSTQIPSFTVIDDRQIEFTVPSGATGGVVTVTQGEVQRATPYPFTVTLNLQRSDLPGLSAAKPIGVTISADDSRAFVSNQGTGSITVYDLNLFTVVDADGNQDNGTTRIQVGSVPSEAVLTRDGRKLLTLDYGTPDNPGDSFFVVDVSRGGGAASAESYNIEATVQVGSRPTRIATSPDGRRWFVTNFLSSTLSVVSAEAPYEVVATVPTGRGPNGVGISPDGTRCYVCNFLDGSLTILDTSGFGVVGTVPVGLGPSRAIVSPNGRWVLVSCNESSTLHVVDAVEKRNVLTIPSPAGPSAMTFSRSGDQVFVCSRVLDVVAVYDFMEVDGVPQLSQPAFIQAGRVPSGIAVTRDGSRIVIAHERDGDASVVWLQPPVQSITDIRFVDGTQTRSADEGQDIVIIGAGFSPVLSDNRVRFGDTEVLPSQDGSSKNALRVRIPLGAASGPLTVAIGDVISNAIDFQVTPAILRVTRILPANGAFGISPNTEIVCRCNEPVLGGASDWIVERLLDTFTNGVRDVDPNPIVGTVRLRDFGYEMVFTPSAPLVELPNSNNFYRVTIRQTLTDRAGNPLQRDVQSVFQLADTRGPTLLRAVLIDVDNNGVDPLDILSLVFDEEVTSRGTFPAQVENLITFNDGSTLGSGATIQFPSLALIERTSPVSQLDPFSRTMMIRLGSAPSLLVPGLRTAISGVNNFTGDLALRDASGNASLSQAASSVDVEFFVDAVPAPRALAVVLQEGNSNGIGEAGEEIGIYCNTPLTKLGTMDVSDLTLAGAGVTFGSNPVFDLYPDNHRVLRITLGTGAFVDFNDPSFRISSGNPLTQLVNFSDVPLAAWDGDLLSYSIGKPSNGPMIDATHPNPVVYDDVNGNGVDAGDIIRVLFDRPMVVGNAPAARCFLLPVAGNSFGFGAFVRNSQDIELDAATRARTVEIVLGPNANILPQGTGTATATSFGASSTLVVNPAIPVWAVADEFGISAVPDPTNLVFDVGSSDQTAPNLHEAIFIDNNQNGQADQGDQIALVFNETVRRNGTSLSGFRPISGTTPNLTFGTNPILARAQNRSVQGQVIADNTFLITLGANPDVPLVLGTRIEITAFNSMADASGNTVAPSSSAPLRFALPPDAMLVSATLLDSNFDGINEGDVLYAKFNQPMSIVGSGVVLSDVFLLPTIGDSFGTNASMAFASVTANVLALGLSNQSIGTTERSLIRIVLGANASLSRLNGVALSTGVTAPIGTPSSLAVRAAAALSVSASQLEAAFSSSANTGATAVFNSIRFVPSGSASPIAFSFTLGGGATSFAGTEAHYTTLVGAMNGAFVDRGLRLRAIIQPNLAGVLIADNGEALIGVGGGFDAFGDVVNAVTGTLVLGTNGELVNAVGISPTGRVDISAAGDQTPPAIVSVSYDGANPGVLQVNLSKPIEFPTTRPATQVFQLPVQGDSFGTGATVSQTGPLTLTIALTSNKSLTTTGVFSPAALTQGSPSGLRFRSGLTSVIVADYFGNPPTVSPVDILGPAEAPVTGLSIVGQGALPSTRNIDAGVVRGLAFRVSVAPSTGPFTLESLAFNVVGTNLNVSSAIARAILFEDIDANGVIDRADVVLDQATVQAGSVTFASPIGSREVTTTSPVNLILGFEMNPNPVNDGGDIEATLFTVLARNSSNQLANPVTGIPLYAGKMRLVDQLQVASAANGALALIDGPVLIDTTVPATNHATANVSRRFVTLMTLDVGQLATAIDVTPANGELEDVHIDLRGWQSATITVSTPGQAIFSGGINTNGERQAFVDACNRELRAIDGQFEGPVRAGLTADLGVTFIMELSGQRFWKSVDRSAYDSHGGLLSGGQVTQSTSSRLFPDLDSTYPGPISVTTGGRDAQGNLLSGTIIHRFANGDDSPRLTDVSIEATPQWTPREGHVSVAANEVVYVYGGLEQGASTASNAMWRLVPVAEAQPSLFGSSSYNSMVPMPKRFRWEQVDSIGGPTRHGAMGVYVHNSRHIQRSIVVIGGASDALGANPSDLVHVYSLDTGTWNVLTTSGTPKLSGAQVLARSHATGGMLANNRLVIYGGRTGGTNTTTVAQVFDFDAPGDSIFVSTLSPTGPTWAGADMASSFVTTDGQSLVVLGGRTQGGQFPSGPGAILTVGGSGGGAWQSLSSYGFDSARIPSRFGASIVNVGDLYLAYGSGPNGPTNTLVPISVELPGADQVHGEEADRPRALYAYQHPIDNGTAGHDTGDRVVVAFSTATNLLSLYPSGNLTLLDVDEILELSAQMPDPKFTGTRITLPAGTTGHVESRLAHADTLVISFGGPLSLLESDEAWLSFLNDGENPNPIHPIGAPNSRVEGATRIYGNPDHNRFYSWTGATSTDWFLPANWTVNGAPATVAPSDTSFVFIGHNVAVPCVIPVDLTPVGSVTASVTDAINAVAAQVVVQGARFFVSRPLVMEASLDFPVFIQHYGFVSFVQSNQGELEFALDTEQSAHMLGLGASRYQVIRVTGGNLYASGYFFLNGSILAQSNSIGALDGDGAGFVFQGGENSFINASSIQLGYIAVAKSNSTATLSFAGVDEAARVREVEIITGTVTIGNYDVIMAEGLIANQSTSLIFQGSGTVVIEGLDSRISGESLHIERLAVRGITREWIDNPSFSQGTSEWFTGTSWDVSNNGRNGVGDSCAVALHTNSTLSQGLPSWEFNEASGWLTASAWVWVPRPSMSSPTPSIILRVEGSNGEAGGYEDEQMPHYFDSHEYETWRLLTVNFPAYFVTEYEFVTLRIIANNAIDARVDDVAVLSQTRISGSLTTGSALTLEATDLRITPTNISQGLSVQGAFSMDRSILSMVGVGRLTLTESLTIPSTSSIRLTGSDFNERLKFEMPTVGTFANPNLRVEGEFEALNIDLVSGPLSGPTYLTIEGGALVHFEDSEIRDCGLIVQPRGAKNHPSVVVALTDFTGTPPNGRIPVNGTKATFVSLLETDPTEAQSQATGFQTIAFVAPANSISVESASNGVYPWRIQGAGTFPNMIGAAQEYDAAGTGDPATTGSILWDEFLTILYAFPSSSERFVAPSTTTVMLGSIDLLLTGAANLDSLDFFIRSNVNDATALSNVRLIDAADNVVHTYGAPQGDDPVFENQTPIALAAGRHTLRLMADLNPSPFPGAHFQVYLSSIEGPSTVAHAASFFPALATGRYGYTFEEGSDQFLSSIMVGSLTIGDSTTPTIFRVEVGNGGFIMPGDEVRMVGRNLSSNDVLNFQNLNNGLPIDGFDVFASNNGARYLNVVVGQGQSNQQFFNGRVEFTMTRGAATPIPFVFASAFGSSGEVGVGG